MNLQIGFQTNMEELNAKLDKAIETLQFSGVKGPIHVNFSVYPEASLTLGAIAKTVEVVEAPAAEVPAILNETAPKKEKKAKAPKQEVVEAPKEETAVAPSENSVEYSRDDITKAAQKLSEAKNTNVLRALLVQFKAANGEACKRLSDIQDHDIAMWVKACDEAAL